MVELVIATSKGCSDEIIFLGPIESTLHLAEMKMFDVGRCVRGGGRCLDFIINVSGVENTLMFDGPPEELALMCKFFFLDEVIESLAEGRGHHLLSKVPYSYYYKNGSVVIPQYVPALVRGLQKGDRIKVSYLLTFGVRKEHEIRESLPLSLVGIAAAIRSSLRAPLTSLPMREI